MKRLLFLLFTLISINVFSQINVKEGSFRRIEGYLMLDKEDHRDINWKPMALIKISTEGMKAEERARLIFKGNLETYFDVVQEPAETHLYISAQAATFIEIQHPDYGKTEYWFPQDLCDFCGYEMVIEYKPYIPEPGPAKPQNTYFIIKSDQNDALIYIDNEFVSTKEASKLLTLGSTHSWRIECNMYHTESGTVTLKEKTVINKQLRPAFGYLNISTAPEQGARVYVDGEYIGDSPCKTDKLKSGTHNVRVMKDMYKMTEESITVVDGKTNNCTIDMAANFVTVTVTTDKSTEYDIYVDEMYKGSGTWVGKLSKGNHLFEARKDNHRTSSKNIFLGEVGTIETIILDSPTPINGTLDINSNPMGAAIYIDGKSYGETPNYITDVLIGEHELKLSLKGHKEVKRNINIKEDETLSLNLELQKQENAEELFNLGYNYDYGKGVQQDYAKAVEYYTKAANMGHAGAQCNLGVCYKNGQGVKQDYAKAIEYYTMAANQGNKYAQYNLGYCYDKGQGVNQDYAKAAEWYQKAANQGHASAQNSLGICYKNGQGVKQDYAKAVEWYQKAANQGHANAQNSLGLCYEKGRGVKQDYAKAIEYYTKAANQGNMYAQYNLGICYYYSRCNIKQDYTKAVEWYQKAANQGHAGAQFYLGYCYKKGQGVQQDYTKAVEWYQKAANQGDADAQNNLGFCYDKGQGVKQDYTKAVEYYTKAANQGHANAQNNLGIFYENGQGVKQDYAKAVEWYQKAANQGNMYAQYNLGTCYEYGRGVNINKAKAVEWYQKAANQGYEKAKTALKRLGF